MILTEEQSIQLSCILIESAASRGEDKKTILQKLKAIFDRAIRWIKNKSYILKVFITRKVASFKEKVKTFYKRLTSKEVKEKIEAIEDQQDEEEKEEPVTTDGVDLERNLGLVLSISNKLVKSSKNLDEIASKLTGLKNIEANVEELDRFLDQYAADLATLKEDVDEELINSSNDSVKATVTKAVEEAEDVIEYLLDTNERIAKGNQFALDIINNITAKLEKLKQQLENDIKAPERAKPEEADKGEEGTTTPTKLGMIIGKLTRIASAISSGVTTVWGTIVRIFRKIVTRVVKLLNPRKRKKIDREGRL